MFCTDCGQKMTEEGICPKCDSELYEELMELDEDELMSLAEDESGTIEVKKPISKVKIVVFTTIAIFAALFFFWNSIDESPVGVWSLNNGVQIWEFTEDGVIWIAMPVANELNQGTWSHIRGNLFEIRGPQGWGVILGERHVTATDDSLRLYRDGSGFLFDRIE